MFYDEIYPPKIVSVTIEKDGDDVAQIFVDRLRQKVKDIYDFIKEQEKKFKHVKNLKDFDREVYETATTCHICNKPFKSEDKQSKRSLSSNE